MPTYIHRPSHPEADEHGMVEKQLFYAEGPSVTNVISDTMASTRHMCDGNHYESKSQFRKVTKAYGCIEFGNEEKTLLTPRKPKPLDRGQRRDALRKAIYDLRDGRTQRDFS